MRFLFIIVVTFFTLSAYADSQPIFVAQHENWEVYTQVEGGQKVCFIMSSPIEKAGNYTRRGHSHVWIRHISKNIDEISLTPGYKYQPGTPAQLAVHDAKTLDQVRRNGLLDKARNGKCTTNKEKNYSFDLVDEEQAWARETETDKKLIADMKRSYHAVVVAVSKKGTCSTDIYSLIGFTKAYNQMKSLCE